MEDTLARSARAAAQLVVSATHDPLGRTQSVMLPLVDKVEMLLLVDKVDWRRRPWHNLTDAWLRQSETFTSSESQSSQAIQVGKKRGLIPLGRLRFR